MWVTFQYGSFADKKVHCLGNKLCSETWAMLGKNGFPLTLVFKKVTAAV